MISHLTVGTGDLGRAEKFYSAVLGPAGWRLVHTDADFRGWSTGFDEDGRPRKPMFWVARPFDRKPMTVGNGVHVAFLVDSADEVDAAHERALKAGGVNLGTPGFHPEYHERYYGGFFGDLDGNKMQFCCHRADPHVLDGLPRLGDGGCG